MLTRRYLALASAAVTLVACATARQPADATTPVPQTTAPAAQPVQWTASLAPQSGSSVTGSATVVAVDSQQTSATVTLSGAAPGAIHPWHIHAGRCGDNGPIVGPATAYPVLTVGSDGSVTVTATLPFATPMSGNYYVNVHRSPTEMGTIVACGNLSMGAR